MMRSAASKEHAWVSWAAQREASRRKVELAWADSRRELSDLQHKLDELDSMNERSTCAHMEDLWQSGLDSHISDFECQSVSVVFVLY